METNLEKAKRLTKDNAAIRGIDLPDTNFFYEMLDKKNTISTHLDSSFSLKFVLLLFS